VLVRALAGLGIVLATLFVVAAARVTTHDDRERQLTSIAGAVGRCDTAAAVGS
jgi:hypothetical protein